MPKFLLALLVGLCSFIAGGMFAFWYATANPPPFAQSWATEAEAKAMLDAYLSMDAFGGPDGEFTITQTDNGVWVLLKGETTK